MRSARVRDFVENELPFKLLVQLYKNSRTQISLMSKELRITTYRVKSCLELLERRYGLSYTLRLSSTEMGFTEGRIITIKFGIMPDLKYLKRRLLDDIAVQDAYLSTGDFDLLVYAVGLTSREFLNWQFKLRQDFSTYKPVFKIANAGGFVVGFFPIRNELIMRSRNLSELEKRLLTLLNDNSRMRLTDIIKQSKSTQMKVLYTLRRLEQRGIITKYTSLVQKTDKAIRMAYVASFTPIPDHHRLRVAIRKEIMDEDLHESTNDYCVVVDGDGAFNSLYVCTFKDSDTLFRRGPALLEKVWKEEEPKIEKAVLVGLLVGKWPFHLEEYGEWSSAFNEVQSPVYNIKTGELEIQHKTHGL